MSKLKALSGFPEWLPEQELVQQQILDTIQRCYTLHGFAPLRTRAMEPLSVLLAKGETSKEVYVLSRLQSDEREPASASEEDGLGLHFDLTVPFARYVVENRGRLSFPYRRYQVQPVWRGERPQLGRYREFIQADVDVIGSESLHVRHDAEIVRVIAYTLGELPIPQGHRMSRCHCPMKKEFAVRSIPDGEASCRCATQPFRLGHPIQWI